MCAEEPCKIGIDALHDRIDGKHPATLAKIALRGKKIKNRQSLGSTLISGRRKIRLPEWRLVRQGNPTGATHTNLGQGPSE